MLDSLQRPGLLGLVLLGQLLVAAPHFLRLPVWLSAFGLAAMAWRYLAEHKRLPGSGAWLTGGLALLAFAGVLLEFRTIAGREPGAALLVVMSCLKVLELKRRRDAFLLILLGYFLIGTNLLFSQTIAMAAYLMAALWFNTLSLICLNRLDGFAQRRSAVVAAGTLVLQALPYMFVLFVLFPRLPGPLWGMPERRGQAVTGMSDSMTPGDVNSLAISDEVAFRVRFENERPPLPWYWRGLVLAHYDGLTWTSGYVAAPRPAQEELKGVRIDYRVALESGRYRWLYALDVPVVGGPGAPLRGDYQLLLGRPVNGQLLYEMSSITKTRIGLELSEAERRRFLQLPEDDNRRSRRWAAEQREQAGDAAAYVERVLRHIRREAFYYTLHPPILAEAQIDDFWFNWRKGFCEHYAGSFVYLMRAAGVPARVVVGYQGGERSVLGDYVLVRQADAHAWTEVWLDGEGWRRIDPTAAIAPERVEQDLSRRLRGLEPLFDPVRFDSELVRSFWEEAGLYWDSVNNAWNTWIVAYDQERQGDFLSLLGLPRLSGRELGYVLATLFAAFVAAGGVLILRERRAVDNIARTYAALERRLARRGYVRADYESPVQFLARIGEAQPGQARELAVIAKLYTALRYRNSAKPLLLARELRRRVAALRI